MINFLIFLALSFQYPGKDWKLTIELLRPAKRDEVVLRVLLKNVSTKKVKIQKNRKTDYIREKVKAIGNYVIQIEKYESSRYQLFVPSADIDPTFDMQEFTSIKKGGTLLDTLYINGIIFSGITEPKGLPRGKYRIKIFYNADMWHHDESNNSNWVEFAIK